MEFIDAVGTLHMRWDNGRTLGVVIGEDRFQVVGMACPECLQEQGHKMDCSRRRQSDPHDYEEIVDLREEDEIPLDENGQRS